ncbi:MAG: DUF2225 domain-containing protein [Lachnospiraceae bacterium]
MGLFSGLESLGFKNTDMKVYSKEPKETGKAVGQEQPKEKKDVVVSEKDCLFPKTYQCPVCDKKFMTLAVRAGKVRSIGQDEDLRPLYREMDPLKYDAIVCPHCGYAALSRYFNNMMPLQGKKLRAEIQSKFSGIDVSTDCFDYDEAIMRYKMVLLCDVVGGVKNSRKAYTCLKLAWVIRGKLEKEGPKLSPSECEQLHADELECIQNAYEGYTMAFSTENFPMSGMDEITVTYLTAELAFKLEKYREALQLISKIIGNNSVSARIKDKSVDLKERIRAEVKTEK